MIVKISLLASFLLWNFCAANSSAQSRDDFLGVKMRSEVQAIIKEIEVKTNRKIYREFVRQEAFHLGSSFIDEDGLPVVLIDFNLEKDEKKLEAVIVHELLHLQLIVNNFPIFLFSPTVKTAKGRAIDVEQENVNDLKNLIDHRVFQSDMEKLGLDKHINLAGDAATQAKKMKGQADGQTEVVNYVRAMLEYQNARDVLTLQKIYEANGWTNSLKTGREIAALISSTKLQTPKDVEAVFLRCLLKLYPPPNSTFTFRLTVDPHNKIFRRMIINIGRTTRRRS